jgi:TolC family type I secretion outer membrane protein
VRRTSACLAIALLAAAHLAAAQNTVGYLEAPTDPIGRNCTLPPGPLSFPTAVDYALCRNPTTRSAWAAAREQAAALGVAKSTLYPSLSATGAATRSNGQQFDVTGNPINGWQNTADATIDLNWLLYDFGGRSNRIASARHLFDAAGATAHSVVQQTVRTLVQSYYGVVAADASLVAATMTQQATAKSLQIARALQQGGIGTMADVLQAQTADQQAVIARVQAEAATQSSRGTLNATLGLNADHPLQLEPDPLPTEVPALSAKMASLMAEAEQQRPDLAAARAQRDAAAADVKVARATGLPTISVGGQHSYVDITNQPNQNFNQFGVTLTVPIFTGFSTVYGVRQAKEVLEQRNENAEQVRLAVSQDVWNAYYGLDSANQQLSTTAALVKTADENQEVALGRYQSGVGTIIDVLTAQNAASTARQLRINAELGWKVARAQMAFALGRLINAEPLSASTHLP